MTRRKMSDSRRSSTKKKKSRKNVSRDRSRERVARSPSRDDSSSTSRERDDRRDDRDKRRDRDDRRRENNRTRRSENRRRSDDRTTRDRREDRRDTRSNNRDDRSDRESKKRDNNYNRDRYRDNNLRDDNKSDDTKRKDNNNKDEMIDRPKNMMKGGNRRREPRCKYFNRSRSRGTNQERRAPNDMNFYSKGNGEDENWLIHQSGRWRYHPEVKIYHHKPSKRYYVSMNDNNNNNNSPSLNENFRRIESSGDPILEKLWNFEKISKNMRGATFIDFHDGDGGNGNQPISRAADDSTNNGTTNLNEDSSDSSRNRKKNRNHDRSSRDRRSDDRRSDDRRSDDRRSDDRRSRDGKRRRKDNSRGKEKSFVDKLTAEELKTFNPFSKLEDYKTKQEAKEEKQAEKKEKEEEKKKKEEEEKKKKEEEEQKKKEEEELRNATLEGIVQRWDDDRGFGFLYAASFIPGTTSQEVFVHRTGIVGSTGLRPISLTEGSKVLFKLESKIEKDGGTKEGKKKLPKQQAVQVVMVDVLGKPLPIHDEKLDEKRGKLQVDMESFKLRAACESWPGKRRYLQDRSVVGGSLGDNGLIFSVFDGHGGSQVAELCQERLHKHIHSFYRMKQVLPNSRDEKVISSHLEAFAAMDREIIELSDRKNLQLIGSTCCQITLHGNPLYFSQQQGFSEILHGNYLQTRMLISNLGDSRAILCRDGKAIPLSDDQKPIRPDEKARVERAGGKFTMVNGAVRVVTTTNPALAKTSMRHYQGITMTRSFGDMHFKTPSKVIESTPEIRQEILTPKDNFIVLCTDGVLDVLSNQEIVDLALHGNNNSDPWQSPEDAAKNIVREAFKKGSEDNLTALVLQFGFNDEFTAKAKENSRNTKEKQRAAISPDADDDDDDMDMFA